MTDVLRLLESANPVPDPEGLMATVEATETFRARVSGRVGAQASKVRERRSIGRRWAAALGLVILTLTAVAAFVIARLTAGEPASPGPSLTTEPSTPPVIDVTITWDGETCAYDGPSAAPVGTEVLVTFENRTGRLGIVDFHQLFGGRTPADLEQLAQNPAQVFADRVGHHFSESFGTHRHSVEVGFAIAGAGGSDSVIGPIRFARDYGFICWAADGTPSNHSEDLGVVSNRVLSGTE